MNSDILTDRMILKEKAIVYFKENNIPKTIEKSLNDLFKEAPDDAYGYLSKYFESLSKDPELTKIKAYESSGDLGNNAISIKLFAQYRNEEIEYVQMSVPNNFSVKPGEPLTNEIVMNNNQMIKKCIEIINDNLAGKLIGIDPRNYEDINLILREDAFERQNKYEDENVKENENETGKDDVKKDDPKAKVTSGKNSKKIPAQVCVPDDPPELICPELRAHFSTSMALTIMASFLVKQDLYKYTLDRLSLSLDKLGSITIPALPILSNGKGLPGKCQLIKKCLILPNGLYDTSTQIAADLRVFCLRLWTTLQLKFPTITSNDRGEMIPAFDKPEQFLDIIMDILKETELEEKIKIILEIGAGGIFDFNKGKYEVISGQLKSSDELVTMLKDLVDRYPSIVGLVNPLRKQDTEQWSNLVKFISDRCWIIGRSQVFPRVQKIAENPTFMESFPLKVSMVGVDIDGYSLYDDYIKCSKRMFDENQKICVWLEDLCSDNWLTDMSCGLQAYLLVIPSLKSTSGLLNGLYSTWITDNILAMARPSNEYIEKYKIIKQFKEHNIKTVINMQVSGEHSFCGFPLDPSGFSYDPNKFMNNEIDHINYPCDDYGAVPVPYMFDIMKAIQHRLTVGKIAVHCHAGHGRTGMVIACYLIFNNRIHGDQAINYVRKKRRGSIQNNIQVETVLEFAKYLKPLTTVFWMKSQMVSKFSIQEAVMRQKKLVHGTESYVLRYVPKVIVLCMRKLAQIGQNTDEVDNLFDSQDQKSSSDPSIITVGSPNSPNNIIVRKHFLRWIRRIKTWFKKQFPKTYAEKILEYFIIPYDDQDRLQQVKEKLNSGDDMWGKLFNTDDIHLHCQLIQDWFDDLKFPVLRIPDIEDLKTNSTEDIIDIFLKLDTTVGKTLALILEFLAQFRNLDDDSLWYLCEIVFSRITQKSVKFRMNSNTKIFRFELKGYLVEIIRNIIVMHFDQSDNYN